MLAQIRASCGSTSRLPQQYLAWLGRVLVGDFGYSWRIREPVGALILTKLPVTFQLATMAFLIAVLIGVPAGIISAVTARHGGGLGGERHRAVRASRRRISGSASC